MFVCGVPESAAEFARVLKVERRLFGDIALPPAAAHEIFEYRPEVYAVIFAPDHCVAAYSSVFPLTEASAAAFVAGDVIEPELTTDMLLTRQDSHEGAKLYIGSVAVDESYDPLTKSVLLASLLTWRVDQLRHFAINRVSVMMTAATRQGERMIQRIGAREINAGANRKDGYAVYGRAVTPRFLSRATVAIEKCVNGGMVHMRQTLVPGLAVRAPLGALV